MPITKDLTSNDFLKFDRKAYKALSNNGKIVYLAFAYIHVNANPENEFMAKQCNMGLSRYKEAKRELKKNGLLYTQRLGTKGAVIVYHFGRDAVDRIKETLQKKQYYANRKG